MRLNPLPYMQQRVRKVFQRKPNHFIAHLGKQATLVVHGTAALVTYMDEPRPECAALIRAFEREADDVRRLLIEQLNRTFVTPIDREDLFGLSRAIDDVLDYAYSTTNEMGILDVKPNDSLRLMAEVLHQAALELHLAVDRLEREPTVAAAHAFRVKQIANQMEDDYAGALASLFKEPSELGEVMNILKLREIYRHVFHAVGSAEQAANIVSDIIVKFY